MPFQMRKYMRQFQDLMILQCVLFCTASTVLKRPHMIVFYVDDLGWNDVGFHGLTEIPTPNIDALAYDGLILNNYYTYPLCTPSRSSLMSGKLPSSTGLQHLALYVSQPSGLPLDVKILPEFLNDLGYESHMVGKWHLGFFRKDYTPTSRGFLSHYGFWPGNSDHFSHTTEEENPREDFAWLPCNYTRQTVGMCGSSFKDNFENVNRSGEYLTDVYTERSTDIILKHNKEKPLFLYLAHHGVHRGNMFLPVRAPENMMGMFTNLKDNPTRQNFAGALTSIDRSLGELMEALEKRSMLKDTIILFATDNGAPRPYTRFENGGSNYPLRGGKETVWEGGIRGTAFLWDGQHRLKGKVYKGLMHVVDWLPTLYAAAGGTRDIVKEYELDGVNMWISMQDKETCPRQSMLLQADPIFNLRAYRCGDYKLISGQPLHFWDNDNRHSDAGRGPPPKALLNQYSKTQVVLNRTFGSIASEGGSPIEVNCGAMPYEADPCDPVVEPCLFNVLEDPCEQRNIAKHMPQVVMRLEAEMKGLKMVPPWNPKMDYDSNPDYWGGYWTNWQEYPQTVNGSKCTSTQPVK